MEKDLTLLLTLKGRDFFTLRWMYYANKLKLPYHIYIADGEVNPEIKKILESKELFPHLSYEYHKYNDLSLPDFYFKVFDSLQKIKTRYVQMCDNDDFVLKTGINLSLKFLDQNNDFVCAQGNVAGLLINKNKTYSNLYGKISKITPQYSKSYMPASFLSNIALERTLEIIEDYRSLYYAIFQTNVLKKITQEIVDSSFSHTGIHERFIAYRAASFGKIKIEHSYTSYLRQYGTSNRVENPYDWVDQLIDSNFTKDHTFMINHLCTFLSRNESEEIGLDIKMDLINAYKNSLRKEIKQRFTRKTFSRKLLNSTKKRILHLENLFFQKNILLKSIKKYNGPAKAKMLKREINVLKSFLEGNETVDFIKTVYPECSKILK